MYDELDNGQKFCYSRPVAVEGWSVFLYLIKDIYNHYIDFHVYAI
jgi:hypothetical protein